jgi:hypothetical protein
MKKPMDNYFDHAVQKQTGDAKKMITAHALITNTNFSDLKFQNPALMDSMHRNKIWRKHNQSESLEVSALGFIQDVHPRVSCRDDCRFHLEEAVHNEMTSDERTKINGLLPAGEKRDKTGNELKREIKVEVIARHIGFGNGDDRMKMDAFEIRALSRSAWKSRKSSLASATKEHSRKVVSSPVVSPSQPAPTCTNR